MSSLAESSASPTPAMDVITKQLRGSSLLVFGRLIAVLIQFAAQIVIARYLSKADYGSFAYALSVVTVLQGLIVFGLPDTVSRFVPVYREQGKLDQMLGTIILAFITICILSLATILIIYGFAGLIGQFFIKDRMTMIVLLILCFTIPTEGLGLLLTNLFASFANAKAIFWRKSVLAPGLRLIAAMMVVVTDNTAAAYGWAYTIASLLGFLVYLGSFIYLARKHALLPAISRRVMRLPFWDVFSFAIPLLTTTVIWLLIEASNAILLGYFKDVTEVASFQVVLPMARMNQLIMTNAAVLFLPAAAKLYSRQDTSKLEDFYWKTAIWIIIASYPIFGMSFAFSQTLVTQFYGAKYQSSAIILSLLSVGYFVQVVTGFNGLMLKTYRKLRFSVTIDVVAGVFNIVLNVYLIRQFGAIGAAVGTAFTLILHNILKQAGLIAYTGFGWIPTTYLPIYGMLLVSIAGLAVGAVYFQLSLFGGGVLALMTWLWLIWMSRFAVRYDQLLPEAQRIPVLGAIIQFMYRERA